VKSSVFNLYVNTGSDVILQQCNVKYSELNDISVCYGVYSLVYSFTLMFILLNSFQYVMELSGSLTRVDDLGKKDQKMLNTLAHIELTTIFDEFNIKFSRRKAKQKVKGILIAFLIFLFFIIMKIIII